MTKVNYTDQAGGSQGQSGYVSRRKGHIEYCKRWLNDGVPGMEILRKKNRYVNISEITQNSTLCMSVYR